MGRRLGQHFLKDPSAVSRILHACRLQPSDTVVEIGPGRGALTRPLAASGARLFAVELDRALAAGLDSEFAGKPNVTVIEGDFLELPAEALPADPLKFVGNLPYYVTGPILRRILRWPGWTLAVVMVQDEVADRLVAAPGGKAYGPLTLETALRAEAEKIALVRAGAFSPPPKVDSAVVRLAPRRAELGAASEDAVLEAVYASFGQRRKKILNSVSSILRISKPEAEAALRRAGIDPSARAETLPLEAFVSLAASLGDRRP